MDLCFICLPSRGFIRRLVFIRGENRERWEAA
jgi:hypothetical protein